VRPSPRVTIILATYNQQAFVREAMESALAQTYPRIEIIVDDNGSTDGTAAILSEYAGRSNVSLTLHDENESPPKRLNEAIARSTGELISILYGDDMYRPNKIERQVEAFRRLPSDHGVVYGPVHRINVITGDRWLAYRGGPSGSVLPELLRRYVGRWPVSPISPLTRRECFLRYPCHEAIVAEGEAIFLFFALSFRFQYIDEPFAVMREHEENAGKQYLRNFRSSLQLLDAVEREPEFPHELRPLVRATRAARYRAVAWLLLRLANDPVSGRDLLVRSVQLRPRSLVHPRTLAGAALSLLPSPALRHVNAVLNKARRHRENLVFRHED